MAVEVTEKLQSIVERYRGGKSSLIGVMQDISQEYGYLPEEVLKEVAGRIEVPISIFYSLATFYSSFRLEPIGRKHVCVCVGTACHVRGAAKIVDTLETVNCVGACALGPLVTVNGEYYGKMDQKKISRLVKSLRQEISENP